MGRYFVGMIGSALFILLIGVSSVTAVEQPEESFFLKSLHHTGEGMRYWYEEPGGFMDITEIPYNDLSCKSCHIKTCDACHAKKEGEISSFSVDKARDMATCLPCHSRAGLTFKMGEQKDNLDVHIKAGMNCSSCHKGDDVHGTGEAHTAMRDPGAVNAKCANCHASATDAHAPAVPDSDAHAVHGDSLDCAACHVDNTTACMNCHFDTFLATKVKKGNFIPMQDWTLLINFEGKVTSATAMTLVYKDKKFVLYAPYFTHAVSGKGKDCADCHDNAAMKLIADGKSVPMLAFKDGKLVPWSGVAPVVPDKLDWVYLNKDGDNWIPIKNDEVEKVQLVDYGTPLTKEQLESLAMPQEGD